jgi:hypothetical protein
MAVPLAHAIAGRRTDFTLTFTVSLSAALGATTILSVGGLAIQTRRVTHYKGRALTLEQTLNTRVGHLSGGDGNTGVEIGTGTPPSSQDGS